MTTNWPPLDMHAHLDVEIGPRELLELRAVVFAATRTLDESEAALSRQPQDFLAVWGVGVHPGLTDALAAYDPARFAALLARTAFVGEVGLDGRVKSRLRQQQDVLRSILSLLQDQPRITSLHSYAATDETVTLLEEVPIKGAVLHWWLGDRNQTRRAIELGAFFSINAANLKNPDALKDVPLERLLTETDHPDGNRRSPQPKRPGNVSSVEKGLATLYGISTAEVRQTCWANLRRLLDKTSGAHLLPPRIGSILDASRKSPDDVGPQP